MLASLVLRIVTELLTDSSIEDCTFNRTGRG